MSFACREAAGAACRLLSREAAEACGQPRPKKMEIIASAVTARSARARRATEDRSIVILVVPLCPSGMAPEFICQGYRFRLPDQPSSITPTLVESELFLSFSGKQSSVWVLTTLFYPFYPGT
jgi:hypothetical protein